MRTAAPGFGQRVYRAQDYLGRLRSLTHEQVYAVTAYLLYLNGIIGEGDVIDARTLPAVKMPNRDAFGPDARPDVRKTAIPSKH